MRNLLTRISAVPSSSNSRIEIPLSLATATGKSSVQGVAVTEELVERTPHPALSIGASVGTFWRQGGWGLDPGPMDRWNIHARSPLTSLLHHLHQSLSGFCRIAHFTQECDAGAPYTTLGYSTAHENRGGPQLRFQTASWSRASEEAYTTCIRTSPPSLARRRSSA